jgi:hypothetical protein
MKVIEIKMFLFSLQISSETFLILRSTELDMIIDVRRYLCKVPNIYVRYPTFMWGTRWRIWMRQSTSSRKVAGSTPNGVLAFFFFFFSSGRAMALGLA